MPWQPRSEYDGRVYHVLSRGDRREAIRARVVASLYSRQEPQSQPLRVSAMDIPRPIRLPTGAEMNGLFWAVLVVIIGFGVVCLVCGYRAPQDKAPEAAKLMRDG